MQPSLVSVTPLTEEHIPLLMEASRDESLVHNTYLPPALSEDQARAFVTAATEVAFVVQVAGQPAGLLTATPGVHGVTVPVAPDAYETESWLLAQYRGMGLAVTGWHLVEAHLQAKCPQVGHLVGVVWLDNEPSHRRLAKSGYTDRGVCWWQDDDGDGGDCRLWSRCVHPGRPCTWP